jgi:hypothetical protein
MAAWGASLQAQEQGRGEDEQGDGGGGGQDPGHVEPATAHRAAEAVGEGLVFDFLADDPGAEEQREQGAELHDEALGHHPRGGVGHAAGQHQEAHHRRRPQPEAAAGQVAAQVEAKPDDGGAKVVAGGQGRGHAAGSIR